MKKDRLYKLINYVLNRLELFDKFDANQLAATCAVESNLGEYLYQVGGGPALGIYQMPTFVEIDLHDNFLKYNPELMIKIKSFGERGELATNNYYATAMAFMQYYRYRINGDGYKIGKINDIKLMAWYWKKYYNSTKGTGSEIEFMCKYKSLILYNHE